MFETGFNGGAEGLTSGVPYASAQPRALAAVGLFALYAALCLTSILSSLFQIELLSRIAAHGSYTHAEARANDLRQLAVSAATVAVFVAALVLFFMWLHRSYRNLRALGNPERAINTTPGWVVAGFFIPFANLYLPFRAVREVWALSDPQVRTKDDLMFQVPGGSPLVIIWWVVWLGAGIFNFAVSRLAAGARSADTFVWMTKALIVMRLVGLVNAAFTVSVIRAVTRRQEERARHVAYTPDLPPPPPVFGPQPPPPDQV